MVLGRGGRHLKRTSVRTAGAGLKTVLIACCALQRFEGVGEAVAKHRHFATMAQRARDESESPTCLARVGVLYPLQWKTERGTFEDKNWTRNQLGFGLFLGVYFHWFM